jgi:uncharacterized membrane protein|tara:strand:- start:290 stop:793 length:504 start_codon:yes stop_codon:yes gene_type:complete
MIKIESNKENNTHRILLRPNRSTSWRLSIFFIGFLVLTCLSIGIAFAFLGATLILPFAGLEVIFISICVYLVLLNSYRQEVIVITQDKLRIESGIGKSEKIIEYFRMWSYLLVERPRHPWYPAHIVVTSKGERVPVGDFLTEDEKEELVIGLETIINSFNKDLIISD